MDRQFLPCPLPDTLILDNSPEIAGTALDAWAPQHGYICTVFNRGSRCQNSFIESFNGRFRDECLNEHWFLTLQKAQLAIEAYRREYKKVWTHSAIVDVTHMEFIRNHYDQAQADQEATSLALV